MLTLPEQLLLLALHDQKGTILSSASMSIEYGLAGAVIMELALRGKVQMRAKKLLVVDSASTGDDVLDRVLGQMKEAGKDRDAAYWINRLPSKIKVKPAMLERLVQQRILNMEEHKILGLFGSPHYPTRNPQEEKKLREQIRQTVLCRYPTEAKLVALVGLVQACGLTSEIFSKEERKEAGRRIKEIMMHDPVAKAVADTVIGIQAALATVIFNSSG